MRLHRSRPALETVETDSNLSVRFWTQELMVSRNALLSAIHAVGRDLSDVRRFLGRQNDPADGPSTMTTGSQDETGRADAACRVQYVSRAASTLTAVDLEAILSWSRQYNRAMNISGVLLFTGRHFSQILEGPPASVHALMQTIRIDPRHCDIRVVADVSIAFRDFQDWSMAWVEDFGLQHLLEELWWAGSIDCRRAGERAAELVRHLRHAVLDGRLAVMQEGTRQSPGGSSQSQER